jgi:hypothetical protein
MYGRRKGNHTCYENGTANGQVETNGWKGCHDDSDDDDDDSLPIVRMVTIHANETAAP